jgi:hypothetical protein
MAMKKIFVIALFAALFFSVSEKTLHATDLFSCRVAVKSEDYVLAAYFDKFFAYEYRDL